jgi:hypothetical protein
MCTSQMLWRTQYRGAEDKSACWQLGTRQHFTAGELERFCMASSTPYLRWGWPDMVPCSALYCTKTWSPLHLRQPQRGGHSTGHSHVSHNTLPTAAGWRLAKNQRHPLCVSTRPTRVCADWVPALPLPATLNLPSPSSKLAERPNERAIRKTDTALSRSRVASGARTGTSRYRTPRIRGIDPAIDASVGSHRM